MRRLRHLRHWSFACVVLALQSRSHAATLELDDDKRLELGALLQPQVRFASDLSPTGEVSNDFYLRRLRLVVAGAWAERFSFYVATDQPNWGGREVQFDRLRSFFYVQDAFATFRVVPALSIDVGLMPVPFTHQTLQSAGTLNTLDFHGEYADYSGGYIKYPPGAGIQWRDGGVQLRGRAWDDRLAFRAGVFQGIRCQRPELSTTGCTKLNPNDYPWLAASVRYQLLGSEDEFFLQGIYFTREPIVSVGLAGNYQPRAASLGEASWDYVAFAVDGFLDWPMARDQELVFQASLALYRQGPDAPDTGTAWFAELGYRYHAFGPVVSVENFVHTGPQGTPNASERSRNYGAIRGGVNWWVDGHDANIKAEYAVRRFQDRTVEDPLDLKQDSVFTLQAQLRF